jgi:hypothetical protein
VRLTHQAAHCLRYAEAALAVDRKGHNPQLSR